jgi:predicted metal-dependent hydrolase
MAPTDVAPRPTGIPVRRPDVDLAHADIQVADDGTLVPGDPIFSNVLAALSAVFPNGEDFFVDSVRNYRDLVEDDPDLKARVKGFIGQESMHGREHRAVNERLQELGYPTIDYDARLQKRADWMRRRLPQSVQLSVTAASEHFTSVLAHAVLTDEQTRRTLFPSPDMELLITWHALEELEHKDVAFDVLQRANRSYGVRLLGILFAVVGWGPAFVRPALGSIRQGRKDKTLTRATRKQFRRNYRKQRMLGHTTIPALAQYLRPSFHPRDIDSDALVIEWRERLAPRMRAARAS